MLVYHGLSLAPGVAIAAAARLEETFGVPQLAPERRRHMGETLLRAGLDLPDPDQIVIIARHVPPGFLASTLPGLEIIGAALETEALPAPAPDCPVVANAGGDLLAETEEGEIVIVDGDRGRIYVSPDAQTLARYQGPGRRSRRFFLEPAHVEARRGSNGLAVPVVAAAADWDDLEAATAGGADGVLIPQQGTIWGHDEFLTASEQLLRLRDISGAVGGKTLFVQVPLERVALSALAQAASWGPVHLVVDTLKLAQQARAEMDGLEPELDAQDIAYGRVALDAVLDGSDTPSEDALSFVDGLFVVSLPEAPPPAALGGQTAPRPPMLRAQDQDTPVGADKLPAAGLGHQTSGQGDISTPPALGAGGPSARPPRLLALTAFAAAPDDVPALLDNGATRLLTSTAQVQAVKDAVRRS